MRSPPKPWKKGKHEGYTSFAMEVRICQDEFGNVWSEHDFQCDEDREIAQELSSAGLPQIAHSLLVSAVRHEALLTFYAKMSKDRTYLGDYSQGSEATKMAMIEEMGNWIETAMGAGISQLAKGVACEILDMMAQQIPPDASV